ncbi:MAG: CopG family transcriptional regulator [Pseudohongiellaceae bacterium]
MGENDNNNNNNTDNETVDPIEQQVGSLPSPEQLAQQEETVKITLALSRVSVRYFKEQAKKHNTSYQKMIRRLLDLYTREYKNRDK